MYALPENAVEELLRSFQHWAKEKGQNRNIQGPKAPQGHVQQAYALGATLVFLAARLALTVKKSSLQIMNYVGVKTMVHIENETQDSFRPYIEVPAGG